MAPSLDGPSGSTASWAPRGYAGRLIRDAALVAAFPWVLTGQSTVTPTDCSAHRPSQRHHRQVVWRDSATILVYTRPPSFHAITDVPGALGASVEEAFRARHLPIVLAVAASTLVLIAADESVLDESRRMARRVGLPQNHPSADVRIGAFKLALPTTVGSGLYFLGDGLTSVVVAAGFATRATVADDLRARRVASEVIEALIASGTVTQVLKHVAGRQTPSEATVPRGRWRPFPPLGAYNRNVPAYDAFPSGHLASTMATITVVALNYPEHHFIWPVGYATMAALSFAMVNNGVHWASDYPLALAIGGVIGKVVVDRGRTVVGMPARPATVPIATSIASRVDVGPVLAPGVIGVRVRF